MYILFLHIALVISSYDVTIKHLAVTKSQYIVNFILDCSIYIENIMLNHILRLEDL